MSDVINVTRIKRGGRSEPVLLLVTVGFLAGLLHAGPAAGLDGMVITDDGQPVPGATVTASRRFQPGQVGLGAYRTEADEQGAFSLKGIEAGHYTRCAQKRGSDLLDRCDWKEELPAAEVRSGATLGNFRIVMEKGAKLEVQIDDPGKLVAAQERQAKGVELLIGVWTPRYTFVPATITREDGRARTQSVIVPYDAPIPLTVSGRGLQVDDESGKRLRHGDAPVTVRVVRGSTPKVYQYNIKGLEP